MVLRVHGLVAVVLAGAVLLAFASSASAVRADPIPSGERIRVDPATRQFVGSDGRTRIFHGLALESSTSDVSAMTDAQMDIMASLGHTAVRIAFHWHLVETAPGVYNETYMDALESLVDRFAQRGIFSILDMHQDNWSPMYCGAHGIPSFYAQPANTSDFAKGGKKAFPLPIVPPVYGKDGQLADCNNVTSGPFGWASVYATFAVSDAAQRMYDNADGILDRFGDFWRMVARRFLSRGSVLAYELLNEPWLGQVPLSLAELEPWSNPHWDLWLPGRSDARNIARLNAALHKAIRGIDDKTILFFEPATGGNILDTFPVGMTEGPGGPAYNDRQALSYHMYCPPLQSDLPYRPGGDGFWAKVKEMLDLGACDLLNGFQFDVRRKDAARLGVAGFMTEFGSVPFDAAGLDVIRFAQAKADEALHSWTYWYLTPGDASVPEAVLRAMSRPHARAIAGTVLSQSFEDATSTFTLEFSAASNESVRQLPTEIFCSTTHVYTGGVAWHVAPAGLATAHFDEARQVLAVTLSSSTPAGQTVAVVVSPKSD